MSQETSIIINHNGFLVWGPKGPKNKNKNKNFTLCMTMPQAAGKKNFRTFAFWTIENFYLRAQRRFILANNIKIKKLIPETCTSLELYSISALT